MDVANELAESGDFDADETGQADEGGAEGGAGAFKIEFEGESEQQAMERLQEVTKAGKDVVEDLSNLTK